MKNKKEPIDYSTRDVAEMLYQSMTDHDVGWANWLETINMKGVSVVHFKPTGYNITDKKFRITIEEA
jgi:hypothetical protein